jgi:hypothetical protein
MWRRRPLEDEDDEPVAPEPDDFIEPDEPEECHRYYDGT